MSIGSGNSHIDCGVGPVAVKNYMARHIHRGNSLRYRNRTAANAVNRQVGCAAYGLRNADTVPVGGISTLSDGIVGLIGG